MTRNTKFALGGVVGIAILAWLAFGFFGIHTAFIDDEVSEDDPFAAQLAATQDERIADMEEAMETGVVTVDPQVITSEADAAMPDMATQTVITEASGSLIDHAHAGTGTVNVLSDGTQRFLRFEEDFAIDNGPDLNVYLVRGVDAEGPTGEFDDDFIDLGDLKGNIGSQNYEVPIDVDLGEFDTVVIWCVRFGVAFNAADLAAA